MRSVIHTQAPTPARLLRALVDSVTAWTLQRWLRGCQQDAATWREQATYCQARALACERLAARLARRLGRPA